MAFDSSTRGKLQRLVAACRKLLTDEFDDQLQSIFGIYAVEGRVLELDQLTSLDDDQRAIGALLRDRVKHLESGLTSSKTPLRDAVQRVLREQAFTILNRFAALRMAEERELVLQCVGEGLNSKGFQVFENVASHDLGTQYERYRVFLDCLFDELSVDLGVLFDRFSPLGLLFPREQKLKDFLALLNDAELKSLWREDETIGWIYQYFNDEAERKKMREQSSAPRNSRELAVRNQFFTPRYVVEFLIDNTLGRLWYEMTKGQTALKDQCRYLVRRPHEVFLGKTFAGDYPFTGAAWVKEVATSGDFSKLPENPPVEDLSRFALLIDGYQEIARLQSAQETESSDATDAFARNFYNPRAAASEAAPTAWAGTAIELWCSLFLVQRTSLRHGWRPGGEWRPSDTAQDDYVCRDLWPALRSALQNPPANLPQEEMLRQPQFIPHRPFKDPREIRLLDPACGSMHFGLYAFDLFETIYAEAHQAHVRVGTEALRDGAGRGALETVSADAAAFAREVPRLIIECNIHGIDIDPRAVQIAGLSLWLRAQRAWHQAGVKPADRPRITRSNLVCAEPMPGEKELLREFVEQQFPAGERPAFAFLLEKIFDRMTLAGEAGSLLRIEEEIRTAIADAKRIWKQGPKHEQASLFAEPGETAGQGEMRLDLSGITDEQFWERAEQRIYDALEAYAEQAENGLGFQRRLFADDAAQGFAFIDLCRKRYDVAVMNPPFGEAALSTRSYIAANFAESKDDLYAAFVSRGSKMLARGFLGVIANRTGFFLTGMRRWRESTLLSSPSLSLLADLGDGVLDGALVEAAAYTLHESSAPCAFFRLLDQADKATPLLESINSASSGRIARGAFVNHVAAFHSFPESRISYWAPPSVREIFRELKGASGSGLEVKFGLSTKDDWRFLRLCWEVPVSTVVSAQDDATPERPWMCLAKGGEYSLHFADIHLVANWANRGNEIAARVVQLYPYLKGDANWVLHTEVPYGRPGVTYTKRTTSGFSPRLLPAGCLISDKGCTIFADDNEKLSRVLATYGSRSFGYLLEFNVASGDSVHSGSAARDYEIGTVAGVPIPLVTALTKKAGDDAVAIWRRKAAADGRNETSRYFLLPCPITSAASIRDYAAAIRRSDMKGFVEVLDEASEAENAVRQLYGFDAAATGACEAEFGPDVTSYSRDLSDETCKLLPKLWNASMSELVADTSKALGFARYISKMTFLADRRLELICHRLQAHPRAIADSLFNLPATDDEAVEVAQVTLSYVFGSVFGRWDIRHATGERPAPELPNPFAPLPGCPPGMLQGDDGLPLSPEAGRRLRAEGRYPLDVAWDGILVDDPEHPLDLEARVNAALAVVWGDRDDALEHEACALLGVPTLREWFRRPAGFFADHLKRYSKSRRQAPIYWPLSTASGSYTLWLYYHRLNAQTLYRCVTDFVKPKLDAVTADADRLQSKTQTGGTAKERAELQALRDFQVELQEMHDELLRVAQLPWKPNLNDGVLITASPLWKLFRLPKWQTGLKACWEELAAGDYDWAHLALTIWPNRVRAKCKTDRSHAIAHGLEELCEVAAPQPKAKSARRRMGAGIV